MRISISMAGVTPFHRVLAAISTLLPILSAVTGGAAIGYTMYARSVEFRLELLAYDADATRAPRIVPPTALASRVAPKAVPFFAGADHFRRTYGEVPLSRHLDDVGKLVCATDPGAPASVRVTYEERRRSGERTLTTTVACAR